MPLLKTHGEYRRHERTGIRAPLTVIPGGIAGAAGEATRSAPSSSAATRADIVPLQLKTLDVSEKGIGLPRTDEMVLRPGHTLQLRFEGLDDRPLTAEVVFVGAEHVGLRLRDDRLNERDIHRIIRSAPKFEQLKVRTRRALLKASRRTGVLSINTLLRPVVKRAVRPDFLFAVYGSERDIASYYTPAMTRLMPDTLIGGMIRCRNYRGLLVASHHLESELSVNSEKVVSYLKRLTEDFPDVRNVALVGRLPNFAMKAGIPIEAPFVDGSMGTRYMIWDTGSQMLAMPEYANEKAITVLGGAGRIGNLVCEDMLRVFPKVQAYDPRYSEEETLVRDHGTILRTSNTERLADTRLFIGLTHHGDVMRELKGHLPKGALIADDTHPCISLEVRRELEAEGVRVLKIVLSHTQFNVWPRMPMWNNRDIPGCLVEALVLLDAEREAAHDFDRFRDTAQKMGFHGRLVTPPDD